MAMKLGLPLDIDTLQGKLTGYGEPLDDFRWTVESFPSFFGRTIPREYCLETGLPLPTFGTQQKQTAATVITMPAAGEISSFDMVLHEDQKGSTFAYIMSWLEHVQNPHSGGYYLPFNYKRDLYVQLQNKKGEVAIRALLRGCWPTTPAPIALTGAGSGALKISCGFAVDAMVPNPS